MRDDKKPDPKPDEGHETLQALAGEYEPGPHDDGPAGGQSQAASAAEWAGLFHACFGIAALRLGEHWILSNDEAETLGESFDRVAVKYNWNNSAGPEIGLAVAVVGITAPRAMLTVAQKRQAQESDKDTGKETDKKRAGQGNA